MASEPEMTSLVPGFDFLQSLFKTAGAGLPAGGQWVAPTLDPAELDKRIQDLKTVQFWLEQNARVLANSIQALEVQRMTLTTLQTLKFPLGELTEALKIKLPQPVEAAPLPPSEPAPAPAPPAAASPAASPPAAGADPMLWWTSLTQQFAELAAKAVQDGSQALAATAPAVAPPQPPSRTRPVAKARGDAVPASPAPPVVASPAASKAPQAAAGRSTSAAKPTANRRTAVRRSAK